MRNKVTDIDQTGNASRLWDLSEPVGSDTEVNLVRSDPLARTADDSSRRSLKVTQHHPKHCRPPRLILFWD